MGSTIKWNSVDTLPRLPHSLDELQYEDYGNASGNDYWKPTFRFFLFFGLSPIPPCCFLYEEVRIDRIADYGWKTEKQWNYLCIDVYVFQKLQINTFHSTL